jgi:hypothetical protein
MAQPKDHAVGDLLIVAKLEACELWDGCSQQDSDNLEKLQIEAGRIVTVNLSIIKKALFLAIF